MVLTAFIVNLLTPDLVRIFTTTFLSDGLGSPKLSSRLSTLITLGALWLSGVDQLLDVDFLRLSRTLSSSLQNEF